MGKAAEWVYDGDYVATVASETDPAKTYDIRRRKGDLVCDCASYRFSRNPKTCKHLEAYLDGDQRIRRVTGASEALKATAVRAVARGETFTIHRRGISFDGRI